MGPLAVVRILALSLAVLVAGCAAPQSSQTPPSSGSGSTSSPGGTPTGNASGNGSGNASTSTHPANGTGAPIGTSPPPGSGSASTGPTFRVPVALDAPTNASEPSVVVDRSGHILASAPPGLSRSSFVWRSTDDGRTFQMLANVFPTSGDASGRGGGDSALGADPSNGNLVASDLSSSGLVASSSTDGGDHWCQQSFASVVPGDRQWLAADKGQAYLVYKNVAGGVPATLVSKYSPTLVSACAWLPGSQVGTDALLNGNLVLDAAGGLDLVYLASTDNGASANVVRFARSTDGGSTWTKTDVHQVPAGKSAAYIFPVLASDTAGNLYAAWADDSTGTVDVLLRHSTDHGAHWSSALRLSSGHGTHVLPWLTAAGPGQLDVVWYDTNTTGNPNDPTAMAGALWKPVLAQVTDALADTPRVNVTPITADPIHVGTICTTGTGCASRNGPAINRNLGDFFQVALTSEGRAVVSFASDTSSPVRAFVAVQDGGPALRSS